MGADAVSGFAGVTFATALRALSGLTGTSGVFVAKVFFGKALGGTAVGAGFRSASPPGVPSGALTGGAGTAFGGATGVLGGPGSVTITLSGGSKRRNTGGMRVGAVATRSGAALPADSESGGPAAAATWTPSAIAKPIRSRIIVQPSGPLNSLQM
jgi:hypothetical protein